MDVLKFAILYSEVKREYFPTEEQYITEKDAFKDAGVVGKFLEKMGHKVLYVAGNKKLPVVLLKYKPDICINMVDSVEGLEYKSASIPATLELLNLKYTGTGTLGLSINYNKFLVRELLEASGISVPKGQLFTTKNDVIKDLRFPVISKLNEIHGSVEVSQDSISLNERHLRNRVGKLINTYKQPVLVEEFISGREISAVLLEGVNKKVYPAERKFIKPDNNFNLVTFEQSWIKTDYEDYIYEKYESKNTIEDIKKAFDVLKFSDYARFDLRVDYSGKHYFIDSNPNPAFGPDQTCAFGTITKMYGLNFEEVLNRIISNTLN